MFTEQEIKERIQVLLSQTPVDYGKVIELSNELAKFDSEKVRFTVDAGTALLPGSGIRCRGFARHGMERG